MTLIIGTVAGILTSVSMLPQLIRVMRTKEVADISLWTLLVLIVGVGLWTIYGIFKTDWPVIASNGFAFLVDTVLLAYYYKYRQV